MQAQQEIIRRALDALIAISSEGTNPTEPSTVPTGTLPNQPVMPSSVPCEPWDHATAWREPVETWVTSTCIWHRRFCTGVNHLYRAYADWEVANGDAPCSCELFETLLEGLGFTIIERMVTGLALRGDLEGINVYPIDLFRRLDKPRQYPTD